MAVDETLEVLNLLPIDKLTDGKLDDKRSKHELSSN